MPALNQIRYLPRVSRLVERRLLESDAVGIELAGAQLPGGKSRYRGRIDPSTEKRADRHVGDQPALYGATDQGAQLLAPLRFGVGRDVVERLEDEIPVFPDP